MSRLLVPFTVRNPEVQAAAPPWAEWVEVSGDPLAYWRTMLEHWVPDDDLIVVEHDVVLRPDVLVQFDECPEPWCVFGYADMCHEACREAWANMLGCTRFRKELIAAVPDAVSSIPEDRRGWHNLCDEIAGDKVAGIPTELRPSSLRAAGFTHHWHSPYVAHHPWGIPENMRRQGLDPVG